ncbi:MAG: right-handed parallel beta-helix repeat-containing protein [Clostridia bacterium]|nr:right-handed parallel beta-helix repeat-containing protein [Clostridia bacterium]
MKRAGTLSLLVLLVLAVSLFLSACGGDGGETTPAPETPPVAFSDFSDYTIVYPTGVDSDTFRAIRTLRTAIEEATGKSLSMREDFVGFGQPAPTDTKEILVGMTNRVESTSQGLRRDDTAIFFENNRLVISGGSPASVAEAIEKYIATYIKDGTLYYPAKADLVRGSYSYGEVLLGGVSLGEYVIVRDSDNSGAALYLQEKLLASAGYYLPIFGPRDTTGTEYEIVIGNPGGTGRTPPSSAAKGNYVIEAAGKRVYLHGDGEDAVYSAAMALSDRLAGTGASLQLSFANKVEEKAISFSLFNLNLPTDILAPDGDLHMSTDTVLARFEAAKEALPEEVTVLERVSLEKYPLSQKVQVYVSPDGDDKNPGTKEAPFATLRKAASAMGGKGGGIIWMMEGTYRVTQAITLDSQHSGTRQSPLFIKAYEDGDVTLTANTTISTDPSLWHFVDSAENVGIYERLPSEVRDEVMYTKLSDHGLTSDVFAEINKSVGAPKLYVGEEEYTIARYPNDTGDIKDLLYFTYVYDTGSVTSTSCMLYWPWIERATAAGKDPKTWIVGWETQIPTSDARGREIISWVNTGDVWYFGSTYSGWEFGYYNIALETEGQVWAHNADGTVWDPDSGETPYIGYPKGNGNYSLKSVNPSSYGAMNSSNSPAGRNTYYLFNAVEALDAPGEWYLDREAGILYVYPTDSMRDEDMAISGSKSADILQFTGVQNLVIDGIDVTGANGRGFVFSGCENVVVQNCTLRNARTALINIYNSTDVAVLYSDFSYVTGTMVSVSNADSAKKLEPSGVVIQNCIFHDTYPTYQGAIAYSGYRMVVSHNYFQNTNVSGTNAAECIIEYNVFEGGSKDVTDGGMIYAHGVTSRGNHYRYNLIHMFNATHNAIYNDGMSSGHYTYGNTISFIGSSSNLNKGWYSSTGMGNVCIGNIMILRNPYQVAAAGSSAGAEDGNVIPANSGDQVNESALFYYYFGEEYAGTGGARYYTPVDYSGRQQLNGGRIGQSEAGHWWYGMKVSEYAQYTAYASAWRTNDPAFINFIEGTQIILAAYDDPNCDYHPKYFYVPWYLSGKTFTYEGLPADTLVEIPQYTYLDAGGNPVVEEAHEAVRNADGSITLTYEELAAMERFRRQPAVCVIKDNVLLGGTPTYEGGKFTTTAQPDLIVTDGAGGYHGYVPTSLVESNFFEYLYEEIVYDADNYEYDLLPGAYDAIREVLSEEGYAMIESIDWTAAGLSYRYEYLSGTR